MDKEKTYGPAYVAVITEVNPHPNADRLEIATIKGWQTIVPKGEYLPGDSVVFAEIDSLVPNKPWSSFLFKGSDAEKSHFRIKNMRLRGEFSQGVAFPTSILPDGWGSRLDEVSQLLDILKYEKPIPAQLAGKVKGNFPSKLCHKTDEKNLKSSPGLLNELSPDELLLATLKLDGSSCSVILCGEGDEPLPDNADFGVCSRNLILEESEENSFWRAVRAQEIEGRMREAQALFKQNGIPTPRIVLQGELCGPGVQGNPLDLLEPVFFTFNASVAGEYMPVYAVESFCRGLDIKTVPAIHIDPRCRDLGVLQTEANNLKYPNGRGAEGMVIRTASNMPSQKLGKEWSVKVINQNYKD